jgi:hypothetical protein
MACPRRTSPLSKAIDDEPLLVSCQAHIDWTQHVVRIAAHVR